MNVCNVGTLHHNKKGQENQELKKKIKNTKKSKHTIEDPLMFFLRFFSSSFFALFEWIWI